MVKIRIHKKKDVSEEYDKTPTPRQRRKEIFPEADPLWALAKGIYESESSDFEEEQDVQIDEKTSKSSKKKKKNCVPHNPYHYPAEHPKAGEFSSKDDAGSWSLKFATKGKDCSGKKAGFARVSNGKELFQKPCGRKTKDGSKKHKQRCSDKKSANENNQRAKDFGNCKTIERDKKYSVDKKTNKSKVELDTKQECDYIAPPKLDPKTIKRFQKLANLQSQFQDQKQVKIAAPMFDRFLQWIDDQATTTNKKTK
jgi:hypothetical protein